jgi:sugar phosphate isomerase/epimerase
VTPRILASTTSHKREPLIPTLDVFARLGLTDLDLNLYHFVEGGLTIDAAAAAVAANGQRVRVASGGWCDFFHEAPRADRTVESVKRQVELTRQLGASTLRLFFGRLPHASYDRAAALVIADNLRRLSDRHPDTLLAFENHDGASLVPEICRDVLTSVNRPNIRMNFDPINFARAGVDPAAALAVVRPLVAHVHLKGLERGEFCEFGAGDVNLAPILAELVRHGYGGDFTVEYEGPFDGTLRLYQSVVRARTALQLSADRQ